MKICKKHRTKKVLHGIKNPQWQCLKCKSESLKKTRKRYGGNTAYKKRNHHIPLERQKHLAVRIIEGRIYNGTLLKQPCSVCGSTKIVHAHHEDYSKPLDIIWFCPKHHKERHAQINNLRKRQRKNFTEPTNTEIS